MASENTEQQRGPTFSAYVMLSEGVQFNTAEIRAALAEDYPSLELSPGGLDEALDTDCDTNQFITHPLMMGAKGADGAIASLIRLPGYGTWDPAQVQPWQKIGCPDLDARLARNRSYICVSVGAKSDDLLTTFRAARLCSCIAAVFAKLPVALACYWEPGDHFLSPEAVIQMADKSVCDDWPVMQWLGLKLGYTRKGGQQLAMGLTSGLSHFKGYELSYAAAPVELGTAGHWLACTAEMALAYGNTFSDGDTISAPDAAKADCLRIRVVPAGTNGSNCDVVLLVHPDSPVDHEEVAGPITSTPPPPGFDNRIQPREGFFKRMIRGRATQ